MHKWIQTLMVVLALIAAFPSAATIISGADGPLAPTTDYTLPYRADGIFDFSSIDIGANITLHFDAGITNATLLSMGDIFIAGVIDATGINLILETSGQINLTGTIIAFGSELIAGSGLSNGATGCISISTFSCAPIITVPSLTTIMPPPLTSVFFPDLGPIILSVPEPGTLWLMTLLLPMLALLGRKRK